MGWVDNLDMLAQNGVLDYDAPSYVMGQAPRYVGNSVRPNPFNGPPPNVPQFEQPKVDEFKPQNNNQNIVKTPTWKKWAFGALALGGIIFGGLKFKSKLVPWFKKQFNKVNFKSIKDYIVDKAQIAGNFFKTGWNKFIGLFKSTKP